MNDVVLPFAEMLVCFLPQVIQKFRKFATVHNVHVTLVIHPRKEDEATLTANSIYGGAKATQEADNVMLLQEEEVNPKVKRKYLQVRIFKYSMGSFHAWYFHAHENHKIIMKLSYPSVRW